MGKLQTLPRQGILAPMSTNHPAIPLLQAVVVRTADALARNHTETAIEILADVMVSAEKDSDRIKAASELLDRGHGKAVHATIQLPMSRRTASQLYALDDDELLRIASGKIVAVQDGPVAADPEEFDFEAALASLPQHPPEDPLLS